MRVSSFESRRPRPGLGMGVLVLLALVAAVPAGGQEVLAGNCENRLFPPGEQLAQGSTVGYLCRGLTDDGTFENECVCYTQSGVEGFASSADFIQFQPNDCSNLVQEGRIGPIAFNRCACSAHGGQLRAGSGYTCIPGGGAAETAVGSAVFNGTNIARVSSTGRYLWPGASLNGQPPPVAGVYQCKRDSSCQEQCASCFDSCNPDPCCNPAEGNICCDESAPAEGC